MANANKEAMSSNVPLTELGIKQSRIGGYSSAIPGVNGVYEINGQRYVVKGHDTYESAKAEADMARITRDVFGLKTPNQEAVRIRHPETGDLMFAVRSPYDESFARTTGRFTEDSAFDQLIASVARRDKDLQADNLFDNIVTDVGQAGIMNKASQPRTKTGPTNSALEQLAINLGMTKGGARSHGAEAWNAATANMTDAQIIARIKEAAAKAKAKLSTADIPEDFKYIARDLDDIASADLGPFVAHLRTVFPKEKKPPTAAAIAKKEQQKLLDREERQSALEAGYPAWALQTGGMIPGYSRGRTSRSAILMRQSQKAADDLGMVPVIKKDGQLTFNQSVDDLMAQGLYHGTSSAMSSQSQVTMSKRDIDDTRHNLFGADLFLTSDAKVATTYGSTVFRAQKDSESKRILDMGQSGRSLMAQDPGLVKDVYNRLLQLAKNPPEADIANLGYEQARSYYAREAKRFLAQEGSPSGPRTMDSRDTQSKTHGHSGAGAYDRARLFHTYDNNMSQSTVAQIFREVATKRGWDGLTHLGGVNLGNATQHQVVALFDASGMRLKNTNGQDFSSFKNPEVQRFEDFQSRNVGTKRKSPAYLVDQAKAQNRGNNTGVQTGGIIRAQGGAWVPGKGEGDRVPALLEPGEFVVNKKAAKQYGGMLEDMNWNLAPRFMRGTPAMGQMPGMGTGAVSGGLMAASMASSMMLPVNQFTDALNKSIMALSAFTGILSAMQMLGGRMGGGIGGKLSGIMNPKTNSAAEKIALRGMFATETGKATMKQGGAGNIIKGAGGVSRGGLLIGAGKSAALLTNPIGLAILATTALIAATVKYKKSLDSAKKSADQAFGASKAEAEAFGVELKNVGETIKANQEYTKRIGAQAQQSQSTSQRLDPEKEKVVLDENQDLTKRLRNLSETRLGTTIGGDRSAQGASLLTAKYASLLQQGFSEDDANVMVRTLAKASGAMDAYAQSVNKFGMIKADDPASIIKAQMEGVKTYQNIGNIFQQGERGGFAEGIKSVVEQINLLPPEDQYTGLKTLLSQIENLDSTQLKVAQQAIIDMTKETYGEGSQLFNTQRAIFIYYFFYYRNFIFFQRYNCYISIFLLCFNPFCTFF
jgi:hypothetical protein